MAKTIVTMSGTKGGCGKSFTAAQLASFADAEKVGYLAFDLDAENKGKGGLQNYVPQARKVDIRTRTGLDVLLNDTVRAAEDLILVDMPGGCGKETFGWFEEMHEACEEAGLHFVMVLLVTGCPSSVETALVWASELQHRVNYVVALNPMADEHADFEYWKRAAQAEAFRRQFLPAEILLPSVFPHIAAHLENNGLTLHAAAEAEDLPDELNDLASRSRLSRWRTRLFDQFEANRAILLP